MYVVLGPLGAISRLGLYESHYRDGCEYVVSVSVLPIHTRPSDACVNELVCNWFGYWLVTYLV